MATTGCGGKAGWSMSTAVAQAVFKLEGLWVYFTRAGRTLCLRLLGLHTAHSLDAVSRCALAKPWTMEQLKEFTLFLKRCTPLNDLLIPDETLRVMLKMEYSAASRDLHVKCVLAGFLDPPLSLALLHPDQVVDLMLLGPHAICRSAEKLATFREMVRAYKG